MNKEKNLEKVLLFTWCLAMFFFPVRVKYKTAKYQSNKNPNYEKNCKLVHIYSPLSIIYPNVKNVINKIIPATNADKVILSGEVILPITNAIKIACDKLKNTLAIFSLRLFVGFIDNVLLFTWCLAMFFFPVLVKNYACCYQCKNKNTNHQNVIAHFCSSSTRYVAINVPIQNINAPINTLTLSPSSDRNCPSTIAAKVNLPTSYKAFDKLARSIARIIQQMIGLAVLLLTGSFRMFLAPVRIKSYCCNYNNCDHYRNKTYILHYSLPPLAKYIPKEKVAKKQIQISIYKRTLNSTKNLLARIAAKIIFEKFKSVLANLSFWFLSSFISCILQEIKLFVKWCETKKVVAVTDP
jgi:hypothetical protein